uniref:cystinosin isoform X2 n=1 Tax=Doryrhamphus excisus TaxID=161450 RepID=UPI0025AE9274|nr:cystinosin isoform X2 [Doryrhamphus excisus]
MLTPRGHVLAQLLLLWILSSLSESQVFLNAPEEIMVEQLSSANVTITSSAPLQQLVVINVSVSYSSKSNSSLIISLPEEVLMPPETTSVVFTATAHSVGQVTAYLLSNNTEIQSWSSRLRFLVVHSNVLAVFSQVVGWMYFVSWSVSFYPQVWDNWRRKSVVGLSFDFLALNVTGFIAYTVFNVCLFWVVPIKEQFIQKNPNGLNPVKANDVFFSLHALLLCFIYIFQATIYETGGQRVSCTARLLLLIGWLFAGICLFVAVAGYLSWLDYLIYISYIKLAVTLVKYMPQAVMNYRRKSTVGWCIGNVLLDLSGGVLSILQMIIDAYNNVGAHIR